MEKEKPNKRKDRRSKTTKRQENPTCLKSNVQPKRIPTTNPSQHVGKTSVNYCQLTMKLEYFKIHIYHHARG
jgi:hypothetical protein